MRLCLGNQWCSRSDFVFDLEDFKPLTLADKETFDAHYAKHPPNHSENVFSTLVSWGHFVQAYYLIHGENMLIMTMPDDQPRFRPPSGPRDSKVFRRLFELAKDSGTDYLMVLVDNETKDWLSNAFKCGDFIPHRDYYDYVYLAKDLANLEGKPYLKIRNKINKFNRMFDHNVESMCHKNIDEIRQFLNRWCLWKDCESDPLLENERIAVMHSMKHCFELDLCGLAIRIDGEIQAVTVFEPMNPETAVVHFEKAMPDFDGLYQVINQEAAKYIAKEKKFINRQSDLGIPGLRTAKERYHPHHMVEVYHMVSGCEEIEEAVPEHY